MTRSPRSNAFCLLAVGVCVLMLLGFKGVEASVARLKKDAEPHDPVAATRGLIHRRLGGKYNDQITLRVLPSDADDLDVFELGSDGDKLEIAANSATAMAYGLQWYFKSVLRTQTDWDNHKLVLPDKLPKVEERVRHKRSSKFSYYQNVDTGSYSLWAWSWPQWEKHIDWMALNGINMPLAFTGQEKVWQNTFHKYYNVSYEGLGKFFAGSAFLSWGRMGNLRGSWVKGPLPQAFIDNQYELQLRILQHMREFGMIPALPAFAGHVPEELKLRLPNANFTQSPNWGNFSEEHCCVYMIEPTDPLYCEIGKNFLKEQRALYNYTSSLYQCDTYMEMAPEFTDLTELKGAARAVIDGMTAADPKAVWLMQGWPFVDDPHFWTKPRVKAYLDGVPTDKLIILDFYSESVPIWNKMDNYFGKNWIYCVLHNFGGNTGMRGDLPTLAMAPVLANWAGNGTMAGVGLTMEGIFQNYIVYDLLLQMAWVDTPLDVNTWVPRYATQRYHTHNEHVEQAWNYLLRSVYNRTLAYGGVTKSLVCLIPHWRLLYDRFQPTLIKYDPNDVVLAWKQLLLAGKELRDVDTYRHDLVDVTKQFLSNKLLEQYIHLKAVYSAKKASANEVCGLTKTMLTTMERLEEILATNEDFLLGNWIGDALSLAGDLSSGGDKLTRTKLQEYYEYEARNQVTRWGDNNNEAIHDYAGKEWAGLVKGYYIPRWTMWLSEVCNAYADNREMDEKALKEKRIAFELKWQLSHESYPTTTVGDSFSISKRLYSEYIASDDVIPWELFGEILSVV
ncbi:Alpha-N-acetylglucosaminidase [Phytophthora cactorum]|uniref:Alpha-N-acetylglucosaminidase n=1 Tax=Phytophthora cactorum TaxID=29920 RepID=A0A329T5C1_9STRA|nr:Alpha-N-acetylglucosaminidase [Phytophthora cactorum]KAG2847805.1 Alpha-N-acetylglucosaminidase [Phytophthora cactorum]KAG2849767.1 Alpha-N-acetylglucosaminidase [Phytophthora cactorum]KAG2869322.1 Alpha-N-acetylglucosaminidase [Phytophthora cactorum]KAG2936401.1 Alpha-N-acetylglucosaminidase [Phytophthora cactorum]